MIAYKGFDRGMICRGHQFVMGKNITAQANCKANGFHCAEDPLDCLTYYPAMDRSEYYIVNAGGDMDEDGIDSKISCTELTILKRLTRKEFFLHALAYMADHPTRKWNSIVKKDCAAAKVGYAVVCGINPIARGKKGDILAFAQQEKNSVKIKRITVVHVDGKKIKPNVWYDINLKERKSSENDKSRVA